MTKKVHFFACHKFRDMLQRYACLLVWYWLRNFRTSWLTKLALIHTSKDQVQGRQVFTKLGHFSRPSELNIDLSLDLRATYSERQHLYLQYTWSIIIMKLSDRECAKKLFMSKISIWDSKVCWLPSPLPTDKFIGKFGCASLNRLEKTLKGKKMKK